MNSASVNAKKNYVLEKALKGGGKTPRNQGTGTGKEK